MWNNKLRQCLLCYEREFSKQRNSKNKYCEADFITPFVAKWFEHKQRYAYGHAVAERHFINNVYSFVHWPIICLREVISK